jgi:poly(3-hydroxybutyrate) depolymerase
VLRCAVLILVTTLSPASPALADKPAQDWYAWKTDTERVSDGALTYYVHTPPGYEANVGKRYPLVIILHWSYVSGKSYLHYWRPDGDKHNVILAAPNSRGRASWIPADGANIAEVVRRVSKTHAVDPSRIWLAGYSAGGVFVYNMLFKYPDLFDAVLPLGGRIGRHRSDAPREPGPRHSRVCLFHGEWDRRYGKGSDIADKQKLTALGYDVEHHVMPRFGHWIPRTQGDNMLRCLNGSLPVVPGIARGSERARRHERLSLEP